MMRALAAMLMLAAWSAYAQERERPTPGCEPVNEVIAKLDAEYGEKVIGSGLSARGARAVLLRSKERGTWTTLYVREDGLACVVDGGVSWRDAPVGSPS